jgi:hypothetical protein
MDPILSWVVCFLSAFLLAAGGFLFARAASSRLLARRVEDIAKLTETLKKLLEERKVFQTREDELMSRLQNAKRALKAQTELMADRGGFSGPTELPDPKPYFDRDSAPHLQKVSEDEFEIPDAAARSAREAERAVEPIDELGLYDQTRQVSLHSPENVVQFMQRIDELADENAELRATVEEHEQTIKEKRAEGIEQIHRFAALDATVVKLRAELKRRNKRIKVIEDQLKDQLANDDGPLTNPNEPPRTPTGSIPLARPPTGSLPPPPPPAAFAVGRDDLKISGPHDGPTQPVRMIDPEELDGDEK